jgi:hypothetical protein
MTTFYDDYDDEETAMSDRTLKMRLEVSRHVEAPKVPVLDAGADASATAEQNRIPLTVRSRLKVLRMAPPVDDGFRPFRVF